MEAKKEESNESEPYYDVYPHISQEKKSFISEKVYDKSEDNIILSKYIIFNIY